VAAIRRDRTAGSDARRRATLGLAAV